MKCTFLNSSRISSSNSIVVVEAILLLLLLWSPSIADDDDFLFNVGNMTQHEEEESMCQRSLK